MAYAHQDQSGMIQMRVLETVRNLSGPANNFVPEVTILNALQGFTQAGFGPDAIKMVLGNLVQANRMELFVPINQMASCGGGCGCGTDCCGGCGGGCCGCGRYYRVKIG